MRETLDGLEVDEERMLANVSRDTLAEAERFGKEAAEPGDYLGAADEFVTRALDLYRREA
jgi:hypothetical protein